jgi:60 kDa SS-A/Ro ribonucleoprotein
MFTELMFMFGKYARHVSTRQTPQSLPIPGQPMVANSADGYTFTVDHWKRLERFLILGNEGGTYYATERTLTIENAKCLEACLVEDAARAVRTIVEVSDSGRAPRNDPAVFALAFAAGTGYASQALEALPKVCRIGTHLFSFTEAVQSFRGWGKALKRGVADWYDGREAGALAYQVAKYQQRNGWAHRDVLRLAHPRSDDPAHQAIYRWIVAGSSALGARELKRGDRAVSYPDVSAALPPILSAMEGAKKGADTPRIVALIREFDLPRECIPTEHLNTPEVWEAMLDKMPLTAMIRNLAKMTAVGLLRPASAATKVVTNRLADAAQLRRSRVHPIALLLAAKTYSSGRGQKGSLTWKPVSTVVDALDGAFYEAFANVEPAGKRTLLALDVSGSMACGSIAGTGLTPREASAAMAMVTAKTETDYQVVGFTASSCGFGGRWGGGSPGLTHVDLSACSRLADVVAKVSALPMGGTDCALPMVHALQEKWAVDTFVVYTDNETWAGAIHPVQALQKYRRDMSIPAKLIVVGLTATQFTIADPADAGMLDVVGFDAAAPAVMADFSRA